MDRIDMSLATTPPTSRGEQAKEKLISAAINQFGEYGLHATTRDIAAAAGQNIAAIPYYFGSKEDLYMASAQWIADFIHAHFAPHAAAAEALLNQPQPEARAMRALIDDACRQMIQLMTADETLSLSKFISREQLSPSPAYQLIHDQVIAPLHHHFTHPDLVRPIASITKVMTAMVVLDASLPLDEVLTVDISHTPEMKGIYSRVRLNSQISRKNMLLLALMSSENRAAASLAHHYPGGYDAFIRAMNAKAKALGMRNTHFVEPTGLSIQNVSTARDLTKLLIATKQYPLIGQLSTTREEMATFANPAYTLPFRNTNHLVYRDNWNIQLTKTGFTNAAGHCLVMRTLINNRPVSLVVMDAFGKYTHFADASRLRTWLETGKAQPVPEAALSYKRQKAAQMANNSAE